MDDATANPLFEAALSAQRQMAVQSISALVLILFGKRWADLTGGLSGDATRYPHYHALQGAVMGAVESVVPSSVDELGGPSLAMKTLASTDFKERMADAAYARLNDDVALVTSFDEAAALEARKVRGRQILSVAETLVFVVTTSYSVWRFFSPKQKLRRRA